MSRVSAIRSETLKLCPPTLTPHRFPASAARLAGIAAMHFRPGADRYATSRQVIGKQAIPLVGSQVSIDAGKPQAGGGKAGRVQCRERLLSQKLDFAIERALAATARLSVSGVPGVTPS
jgi:hypothetical protein